MTPFPNLQGVPPLLRLGAILLLLPACTKGPPSEGEPAPPQYAWEGNQKEFLQNFQLRQGRFYQHQDDLPFSGTALVRREDPETPAEIHIRAGLPYRWLQAGSTQPVKSWSQKGLWVGTDEEWEKVFQDMAAAKGIIHLPTSSPYQGMILVINAETGFLETEYHHNEKGLSHGPEIHYDEKQKEVGRFDWVNGDIPLQPI